MSDDKALRDLQTVLTQTLLARVRGGEATAADLNVARQFLKDNNVASLPERDPLMRDLAAELPFSPDADNPETAFNQ